MNVWGISDPGVVRPQNQDSFYIDVLHEEGQAICVVCDGMGGARAGNVASELAAEAFIDEIKNGLKPAMGLKYMQTLADRAVYRANRVVYDHSKNNEAYMGMGTTLVGALLSGNNAEIVNVGDSRAYFIDHNGITRITRDHSVVEDMLRRGDLTYEEARMHPSKNLITKALGTEIEVEPDHYSREIENGTYLLLCSDGLTNTVEDQEILYEVLNGGDISKCCMRLLDIANSRGGPDNTTIVLISF